MHSSFIHQYIIHYRGRFTIQSSVNTSSDDLTYHALRQRWVNATITWVQSTDSHTYVKREEADCNNHAASLEAVLRCAYKVNQCNSHSHNTHDFVPRTMPRTRSSHNPVPPQLQITECTSSALSQKRLEDVQETHGVSHTVTNCFLRPFQSYFLSNSRYVRK